MLVVLSQKFGLARGGLLACALGLMLVSGAAAGSGPLVKERNIGVSRTGATQYPRSEGDQAVAEGWPLYRSERGQEAFNDTMATLKATDAASPAAKVVAGCPELNCTLKLPAIGPDGWLPAGRIWISPNAYLLIAHSPRQTASRQRMRIDMKVFVLHEFQNSSRNTDVFDTISGHKGSVFVPLYMSKQQTDARGRIFVVVVQVAPYTVMSIHATNWRSAGPGMEVAKNSADDLEPLQAQAGILITTMVKTASPQLRVVNHRGSEGAPMLAAYQQHLASRTGVTVALPFTPADAQRVAMASGGLADIIQPQGRSARIPVAQRGFLPPRADGPMPQKMAAGIPVPQPAPALSPLAEYLRVNLGKMMRMAPFAKVIPSSVTTISDTTPASDAVLLMNDSQMILGRIEPQRAGNAVVPGKFIYAPLDQMTNAVVPLEMRVGE